MIYYLFCLEKGQTLEKGSKIPLETYPQQKSELFGLGTKAYEAVGTNGMSAAKERESLHANITSD